MESIIDGMYFIKNAGDASIVHDVSCATGQLKVLEDNQYRWIPLGENSVQSAMKLTATWKPVLPYYPSLLSVLLFKQNPDNVLMLGLGGGELVRYFNHCFPDAQLVAVEKTPEMIEVFQSYFNPEQVKPAIINADICDWKIDSSQQYDIMFLDVYGDKALPDCLYEEGLYVRLYNQLTDDGILAANLAVKDEQEAVLLLTKIRKVFNQQTLFLSVDGHMNIIVIAFKTKPGDLTQQALQEIADKNMERLGFDFKNIITDLLKNIEYMS